jgi:tetratricopeptide (TPR) repeat protein
MVRPVLLVAAAVGLAFGAHFVGENARAAQVSGEAEDDFLYLRMASLGHRAFVADLVWLTAIQYYGEQRITGQRHEQAQRLFQVIYDLDPDFKRATRFGALVLAQDADNPEGAIELLDRAGRDHPEDWEYPFDAGFVYQTVVRDYEAAGKSYQAAADLPGAPDLAIRLAGISFARLGDRETSRQVWQSLLSEDNEVLVRIAERSLRNLDMEDAQDLLTDAVARFRAATGHDPSGWDELVSAGLLDAVPQEPFGGGFFLDPGTGRVWSTTHVDRRMDFECDIYATKVKQIRDADGRWPENLREVVERGLADTEPWEPFGLRVKYDPSDGSVSWNPPWPESEPGRHGKGQA